MLPHFPKRARLFEFALVAGLFGTLCAVLLNALQSLQDDSERLAVELTIRHMNTGLLLQQAERLAAGREDTLRELALANPVTWLGSAPDGYIGEQPCAAVLAAGQWCWEKASRTLYYYPRQPKWLKNGGNVPWLTWRVAPSQHSASFRPGAFRLRAEDDLTPAGK